MKKFRKFDLGKVFENNTFVFFFSIVLAIIMWFYMASNNALDKPKYIYDVPITINLSESAQAEGVQVFDQSIYNAKVSITGNNLVINQIKADDIQVVATLSPMVSKLSGNTTLTENLTLTAYKKGNDLADYQVTAVFPENIEVVYDRYKEKTFDIQNNIEYTAATDYFVSTPVMSEQQVVISGPESSLSKISKVVISKQIAEPVSKSTIIEAPIILLNDKNEPINTKDLYVKMSVENVSVDLEVMYKQTVELDVTVLNLPSGFADSRITIEPATIDIAGETSVVSKYKTITLSDAIDFSKIDVTSTSFEMEIPMPENVKNVTNIEHATVTVNMSGYTQKEFSATQISFSNVPDDKEVTLVTKSIPVKIIGTSAQIASLASEEVYGTVDMAGLTDKNGDKQVIVKMGISGAESCWVTGQYQIYVNIKDKVVTASEDVSNNNS